MTIEDHGGMTIPAGMDELVDALPSSIPPEMFYEEESAASPPRLPSIPRLAAPRLLAPPMRAKTPPPLPPRAKIATPLARLGPSDRPTLSPEELAAFQPANAHVPLAPPSSMSAMMVPSFDSAEGIARLPHDADDEIVPAGVPRPSKWKMLFVFALAAAAAFAVARKLETKAPLAAAASPVSPVTASPVRVPSEPQPTAAPVPSTPPPATPSATEDVATATVATSAVPSDRGSIDTAGAMAGRRVFVDGHVVGQTPAAMLVKCGTHKVKVGSAGHARKLDVPCGGTIEVGDF